MIFLLIQSYDFHTLQGNMFYRQFLKFKNHCSLICRYISEIESYKVSSIFIWCPVCTQSRFESPGGKHFPVHPLKWACLRPLVFLGVKCVMSRFHIWIWHRHRDCLSTHMQDPPMPYPPSSPTCRDLNLLYSIIISRHRGGAHIVLNPLTCTNEDATHRFGLFSVIYTSLFVPDIDWYFMLVEINKLFQHSALEFFSTPSSVLGRHQK